MVLVRVIRMLGKIHDSLRVGIVVLVLLLPHQHLVGIPGVLAVNVAGHHLQVILLNPVHLTITSNKRKKKDGHQS